MRGNSPVKIEMHNGIRHLVTFVALLLLLLVGPTQGSSARPMQVRQPGTPSVRVILNGLRSTPETIDRLAGQDLHYFLDAQALREGVVYVFTSPEARDYFVQTRRRARNIGANLKSTAGPTATFWQHANRAGASIQYSVNVLSLGAWNDIISSLETGTKDVRLWEHYNFGGSSMTVAADTIIEDLEPFGFNDRISSIQFL
jgi:hypothetical protein